VQSGKLSRRTILTKIKKNLY